MTASTLTAPRLTARRPLARIATVAAGAASVAFAASAVLQLADLNWVINKVQTVPQHLDMAWFAVAIAGTLPALAWLGRQLGRVGRLAAASAIVGQTIICAITTVSNLRGVDASWFNPVAAVANLLWVPPLIALAVLAYRRAAVPRPLAIGLILAYAGTIPLAMNGGGLLAAAYWAMIALHLRRL